MSENYLEECRVLKDNEGLLKELRLVNKWQVMFLMNQKLGSLTISYHFPQS